jgi:exosortase/archaeosortase family protein
MLALGLGGFILAMGFLVSGTDAAGGAVALKRRSRVVALLVFPALAWLISAPMLLVFESRVKPVLLEYVVRIVSGTFDFLGYEVIREGSVLVLPTGSVGVADACSGIRSLTACMFAGSFLSAIFLDKYWRKILLLVLAAILAFGMNIVRSMFLTAWAYNYGSGALDADFWLHPEMLKDAAGNFTPNPAFHLFTVHDFAGYSILLCTLAGLLLLLPVLSFKFELDDEPAPPPAPPPAGAPSTS